MSIKDELREVAFRNKMEFFAAAPVKRWANAPEGHRPNDFLPDAKTVIVMGIHIAKGEIKAHTAAFEGSQRETIMSYNLYGLSKLNSYLNQAVYQMGRYIEKSLGGQSFMISATTPRDEYKLMGAMSNRHSAVAAGLAAFGWNGLALTPEYGPRARFCQVITDLEMEYDEMLPVDSLCDPQKCGICVKVCPAHALPADEAHEIEIDSKIIHYGKLNRSLCRYANSGLTAGTAGRLQSEQIPKINSSEDWWKYSREDDKWNMMEQMAVLCGRCLAECPVGKK